MNVDNNTKDATLKITEKDLTLLKKLLTELYDLFSGREPTENKFSATKTPSGPAPAVVNTGLDESHSIEVTWYKPFDKYKPFIQFDFRDERYLPNTSKKLPLDIDRQGRSLGVKKWINFWSKFKNERKTHSRTEQNALRGILNDYSVEYDERRYEIDHVLDLQLGGNDEFKNLWPLETEVNQVANGAHRYQEIWFRESEASEPKRAVLEDARLKDRWFVIRRIVS